jgi:protein-disulfide isomerase
MNKKTVRFIEFAVVIIAIIWFVSLAMSNKTPENNTDNINNTTIVTPIATSVTERGNVTGNKESSIELVEYSDFQCPACRFYYPIAKQAVKEFGNQIKFTYHHFPLRRIHTNANIAAIAAEAANEQGSFWEMHDLLFEKQREWSDSTNAEKIFIGYAENLGLDVEKFKTDLDNDSIKKIVDDDYNSAVAAGINATPTFILNGEKLQNIRNYDNLKSAIENTISKNQ